MIALYDEVNREETINMTKDKYPKRHVLGEGFPWAMGVNLHKSIGLCVNQTGIQLIELDVPDVIWLKGVPKYRLVLERIEEGDPK